MHLYHVLYAFHQYPSLPPFGYSQCSLQIRECAKGKAQFRATPLHHLDNTDL